MDNDLLLYEHQTLISNRDTEKDNDNYCIESKNGIIIQAIKNR